MDLKRFADYFLFRFGGQEDNYTDKPEITFGAIVWGVLFRSSLIIVLTFLLINRFDLYGKWLIVGGTIWFFALFPGYKQYQNFQERITELDEGTLCGSCKHYNRNSQLCLLYDSHVSNNHIPCGGVSWEPKFVDVNDL